MILTDAIFGQGNEVVDLTPNTFIGGIGTVITTPAELALKLRTYPNEEPFPSGNIKNFKIKGNDIEFRIDVEWTLKIAVFNINTGEGGEWEYGRIITYFRAYGANFKRVSYKAFSGQPLKIFYAPLCLNYADTLEYEFIFRNIPSTCKLYVHPSMQTINNGNLEGDLLLAQNKGAKIHYVQNFIKPNPITDLSMGKKYNTALQLNFTSSSVNAIDYYECYINGVYKNDISASGSYIKGLTPGTQYDITLIIVDEFYNKSEISNTTTTTTTTTTGFSTEGLVSYYKLDETSGNQAIDSWGANHGVNYDATIGVAGKIGNGYEGNGASSYISISNSISATKATFNVWLKLKNHKPITGSKTGLAFINSSDQATHYPFTDNHIYLGILNSNRQTIPANANIILDRTQWHMLTITSNTITGVYKVYQNAQLIYTGSVSSFSISTEIALMKSSRNGDGTSYFLDGYLDEVALFNIDKNIGEISDIYNNGNGLTL